MTDTPADVRAAFVRLLMRRSEGERAVMAFEMFDLARALMVSDIRAQHPGIGDTDLRIRIFERTYGAEFNERERARIAERIRATSSPSPSPLFPPSS